MRYAVRKVPGGTSSIHTCDVWEVLKHPTAGDPYLIATYRHPSLARWCLGTFHCSVEVQRMGGSVDPPPDDMMPDNPSLNCDLPDEIV